MAPANATESTHMTARQTWFLLVAAGFLGAGCSDSTGSGGPRSFRGSVQVGDTARTYEAYVPSAVDSGGALPLLLVFHGAFGSGSNMRAASGFDDVAETRGFVVAYPDADTVNWAEGCGCNVADRLGINDTAFVGLLIDALSAMLPIDESRVYAAGFSQGGLFTYRLACQLSERFAAAASVAAPMSVPLGNRCEPDLPISILAMQGRDDTVFPWNGGGQGALAVLGAQATAERWASLNGCSPDPSVNVLPDLADDDTQVRRWIYHDCDGSSEVALYEVIGGSHTWQMSPDINTPEVLADFFLDKTRPTP
jgi:polyhydroxybutyrate depolymerase